MPPAQSLPLPTTYKYRWCWVSAILFATLIWAFASGSYPISADELVHSLWARLSGQSSGLSVEIETVIWQLRLPRVLAAALIGAALSAAGAVYQAMFHNPLVSPDVLGVSSGAGLGAAIALFFGLPMIWVQALAFLLGLVAVICVVATASVVRRHDPVLVLVLAGMAVGTLLTAGVALIKVVVDPYSQLPAITFWLLGGLNTITLSELSTVLPAILVGLLPMILLRWRINLLSLGDDEARALGLHVQRLRWLLIACATLVTASAVSIAGIIGWVGLVVPHAARLLVGLRFERLLPASILLGAGFLVATDTLARNATAMELPLGILTAIVGVPCFLLLLARGGYPRS